MKRYIVKDIFVFINGKLKPSGKYWIYDSLTSISYTTSNDKEHINKLCQTLNKSHKEFCERYN